MNPYETEEHKAYVAKGMCPSIDRNKTWCNRSAGHSPATWHEAAYVPYHGHRTLVTWTDDEAYPKPLDNERR